MWMYNYEPLVTELIRLEKQGDKIDHPPNGSKDVSDALAGATWQAFMHEVTASPEVVERQLPYMPGIKKPDNPKVAASEMENKFKQHLRRG